MNNDYEPTAPMDVEAAQWLLANRIQPEINGNPSSRDRRMLLAAEDLLKRKVEYAEFTKRLEKSHAAGAAPVEV